MFGLKIKPFTANQNGDMAAVAIGVTIFLVVIGYVLAPVGLVAIQGVNTTAAGVGAGTANGNIWSAIVPLTLAALIIGVVYSLKQSA